MKNPINKKFTINNSDSFVSLIKMLLLSSALFLGGACGPNGIKFVPNDPDVSPQESKPLENVNFHRETSVKSPSKFF